MAEAAMGGCVARWRAVHRRGMAHTVPVPARVCAVAMHHAATFARVVVGVSCSRHVGIVAHRPALLYDACDTCTAGRARRVRLEGAAGVHAGMLAYCMHTMYVCVCTHVCTCMWPVYCIARRRGRGIIHTMCTLWVVVAVPVAVPLCERACVCCMYYQPLLCMYVVVRVHACLLQVVASSSLQCEWE